MNPDLGIIIMRIKVIILLCGEMCNFDTMQISLHMVSHRIVNKASDNFDDNVDVVSCTLTMELWEFQLDNNNNSLFSMSVIHEQRDWWESKQSQFDWSDVVRLFAFLARFRYTTTSAYVWDCSYTLIVFVLLQNTFIIKFRILIVFMLKLPTKKDIRLIPN